MKDEKEQETRLHLTYPERCACCGDVIPEGRQICVKCERLGYQYHPPKMRIWEKIRRIVKILKS